jgi:2,4-dienoyl-CoA reductase-like NADH-dependent reductase (Old Yellow Enzyme family)
MANRFVIAPLTTDSSHEDGTVTESELEFVRRRAASGFGATISSAAYVKQDGRSWQGIGATHDGHLSSLRRLAEAMRASGGLAILQIYDGGRIAKPELIGERCLRAPSAVASLRPGAKTPRAMTVDEVENLIASFEERLLSPERLALTALRFTELIIVQFTIFFRLGPRQSRS